MNLPSVLRLERYASVLGQLEGQEEIPLAAFVLAVKNLNADEVESDLSRLGVAYTPNINRSVALRAVHEAMAEAQSAKSGAGPGITPKLIEDAEIRRKLMEAVPGTMQRARTREAAWNFAADNPRLMLAGLGRMEKGEVPFAHQVITAKAILENYGGEVIVADEVGLGKTLIGALVVFETLELLADANVLILTPANLVAQWIAEFERFFGLDLKEVPSASVAELESERLILLSIDRAKGSNLAPALIRRHWDLLLIDEAHEIRNQDSVRASFVYTLSASNRVYLTATPVQNSGYDIYHVVNSLRPGFLNVKAVFTKDYMMDERSIRQPQSLQARLKKVMLRKRRSEVGVEGFAPRDVMTVSVKKWTKQEEEAYKDLLEMLQGTYRRNLGYAAPIRRSSGFEEHISQFVLVAMLVLREMSSHTQAALKTLDTALRTRLEALEAPNQMATPATGAGGVEMGWGLQKLNEFIGRHRKNLDRPEAHAKASELLSQLVELFKTNRSVLVFVCFRETLEALTRLVEKRLKDVVVLDFHGELSPDQKNERIALFDKSKPACLISMDAGGQGLNLQSADTVINYDYPWNPMRVEQRIGRVDRYGQTAAKIQVINLVTKGTIERYVYDTLCTKIEVFEHVVGDMMSPLNVDDVLENRIMLGIGDLILSSKSIEDMRERFDGLDEKSLRSYMDRYKRYAGQRDRWIGE